MGKKCYCHKVNKNEMVSLEREPHNAYDVNAIRVLNAARIQVGHIKRELARPLAFILDGGYARLEGLAFPLYAFFLQKIKLYKFLLSCQMYILKSYLPILRKYLIKIYKNYSCLVLSRVETRTHSKCLLS